MIRVFGLYVALAGTGVLVGIFGSETLVLAAMVGVLALVVGMFVVARPVRPPRRDGGGYRKDDMDWPAETVLDGEWTMLADAGQTTLYLTAPKEGAL